MKKCYQSPELEIEKVDINIVATSGLPYDDNGFGGDDYGEIIT